MTEQQHALARHPRTLEGHRPTDVVDAEDRQPQSEQVRGLRMVFDVLVAVGHHRAAAVPAPPSDNVYGRDVEGVRGAHHGPDVEVVLEVLDGDVQRVPGGVQLGDDRLASPVAEPILDVAPISLGEKVWIQARIVGPGQRVGADGHAQQGSRLIPGPLMIVATTLGGMPIATPEVYAEMLDRAKAGQFAYPAINVTSSQSLIAALRGFTEAGSDGIIQFSWGGAEFASGQAVKDMVTGAVALAEFAYVVAEKYPVNVALHTDHCPMQKLDGFMRPLVDISIERVKAGKLPLFQSHMWDGSAIPLDENLDIAEEMLDKCHQANIIMELEIGVVGGEEDGIEAKHDAKLFSTPEDGLATAEKLGLGERGRYMVAATFGNVHGVYKPGNVVLTPSILKDIQDAVGAKYGVDKPFDLVFHGGSGSLLEEIREALDYGVVKMNVDTDTQYAFSRPVADWMFKNYDGVLKVDGEVGNKKQYDPRAWGKAAEAGMAERVVRACEDLRSAGTKMS